MSKTFKWVMGEVDEKLYYGDEYCAYVGNKMLSVADVYVLGIATQPFGYQNAYVSFRSNRDEAKQWCLEEVCRLLKNRLEEMTLHQPSFVEIEEIA